MKLKFWIPILVLAIGFALSYFLVGIVLAIIFAVLWFNKVILQPLTFPYYFGIEFVTVSIIIIGILYGPVFGFVFAITVIPFLNGLKYILGYTEEEWPAFVPEPMNFADGFAAVLAWNLRDQNIFIIFFVVLIMKYAISIIKDKIIVPDKPAMIIVLIPNFVFNMFLAWQLNIFLIDLL